MSSQHWFIDETTQKAYVFMVVSISFADVGRCRSIMQRMKPKNQNSIHLKNEKDHFRKAVLAAINALPISAIVVSTDLARRGARERGIKQIGRIAAERHPQRIVIERERTQEANDRKALRAGLAEKFDVGYQHIDRGADAALWIADSIAWAYQRGGVWRQAVEPLIVEEMNVYAARSPVNRPSGRLPGPLLGAIAPRSYLQYHSNPPRSKLAAGWCEVWQGDGVEEDGTVSSPEPMGFSLVRHNPDVLTCIANLSSDEVFTPPAFADQMLDTLEQAWAKDHGGASIWENPEVTFLDPFTKSGVFLRQITERLVKGLEKNSHG